MNEPAVNISMQTNPARGDLSLGTLTVTLDAELFPGGNSRFQSQEVNVSTSAIVNNPGKAPVTTTFRGLVRVAGHFAGSTFTSVFTLRSAELEIEGLGKVPETLPCVLPSRDGNEVDVLGTRLTGFSQM